MQITIKSAEIADDVSREESCSAWMDGEESDDIFESMTSAQGRQIWDTYHLIGDVMRNSDLARSPSADFQSKLARALDAELPIVAPPRRRSPWRVGASGFGVLAALATVLWVAEPYWTDHGPATPGSRMVASAGVDDMGLRDYLEAHREMGGPSGARLMSLDSRAGQ
jgi:sigma-E factor negative regulatory protein RseA